MALLCTVLCCGQHRSAGGVSCHNVRKPANANVWRHTKPCLRETHSWQAGRGISCVERANRR